MYNNNIFNYKCLQAYLLGFLASCVMIITILMMLSVFKACGTLALSSQMFPIAVSVLFGVK